MERPPRTSAADVTDQRFADALSMAVLRRQVTLQSLAQELRECGTPVSMATLSYWRTGRSLPTRHSSKAAITQLERLLEVPVGSLASLLPSDLSSRWDPVRAVPYTKQVMALLREMGIDPTQGYTTLMFHDTVRVSRDHTHHHETTRQLLRCEREGLDRIAMVMRQNFLEDPVPLIAAREGCELGRVVQLDDQGLLAAELVLERPLQVGELHRVEYLMVEQMPPDVTENGFTRVLAHRTNYLVIDAIFEQANPPQVQYRTTPSAYLPEGDCEQALHQDLPRSRFVQLALSDASPGMHELTWDY